MPTAYADKKPMKDPNIYPSGWDAERVRRVIDFHDGLIQDEDAMVADIEAIDQDPDLTWVPVPRDIIPAVLDLIDEHDKQ